MSLRFDPLRPYPEETHLCDRPHWKHEPCAERPPLLEWTSLMSEPRPQLRALACDGVARLRGKRKADKTCFKKKGAS